MSDFTQNFEMPESKPVSQRKHGLVEWDRQFFALCDYCVCLRKTEGWKTGYIPELNLEFPLGVGAD